MQSFEHEDDHSEIGDESWRRTPSWTQCSFLPTFVGWFTSFACCGAGDDISQPVWGTSAWGTVAIESPGYDGFWDSIWIPDTGRRDSDDGSVQMANQRLDAIDEMWKPTLENWEPGVLTWERRRRSAEALSSRSR
ncbi:hypothetical protein PG987_005963 [Apiospora arundinis]